MNPAESPRLLVVPDEPNDEVGPEIVEEPNEAVQSDVIEENPLSTEIIESEINAGTPGDELMNHGGDASSGDKQFQIAPPNNSVWGDDPLQSELNKNGQPEE